MSIGITSCVIPFPSTTLVENKMLIRNLHSFNVTTAEAIHIQRELAGQICLSPFLSEYKYVAGADIAYSKKDNTLFAAVVVLEYPGASEVFSRTARGEAAFPYVPGLLTFREAPLVLRVFEALPFTPDVVIFDGQGLAHPRGFGLACHMGLLLDIPSIGCAKSRLVGEHNEPARRRGSSAPLVYQDRIVGAVVRTRHNVRPVFVSPGHKVDIDSAVRIVLETCRGYRLPEPTRLAHILSQKVKREM
jgi:deoxyribonuclease V